MTHRPNRRLDEDLYPNFVASGKTANMSDWTEEWRNFGAVFSYFFVMSIVFSLSDHGG